MPENQESLLGACFAVADDTGGDAVGDLVSVIAEAAEVSPPDEWLCEFIAEGEALCSATPNDLTARGTGVRVLVVFPSNVTVDGLPAAWPGGASVAVALVQASVSATGRGPVRDPGAIA